MSRLHLGSELISSDGVAFYELIKNSLDARSPEIRVGLVVRLDFDAYDAILRELGERRDASVGAPDKVRSWQDLRKLAVNNIDDEAPEANELRLEIEHSRTRDQFLKAIRSANRVEVDDDGDGMSMKTLRDVFLTIGTSNRARERQSETAKRGAGGEHDRRLMPRLKEPSRIGTAVLDRTEQGLGPE